MSLDAPAPAIVAEDLWNACNAILAERRAGRKPPARRSAHLFAGLVFCKCGSPMYVPSNTPKYICRKCRRKVPILDVERIFAEELQHFVFSPEEVRQSLIAADAELEHRRELLTTLEGEQEKLRRESDRLYRLYQDGSISSGGFADRHRPLETRLAELARELPRLQGEIDARTIDRLSREEIVAEAQDVYGRWPSLDEREKRVIVEAIVERITVLAEEIEITLRPAPRPPPANAPAPPPSSPYILATRERTPGVACMFSHHLGSRRVWGVRAARRAGR